MKLSWIFAASLILLAGGFLLALLLNNNKGKHNVSAEIQDEERNFPLQAEGEVPFWLSGVLIRNGPIKVTVDGVSNTHWFDGLAMLHAFSIQKGEVSYSNRFLRTDAYEAVFKQGSLHYGGFSSDPCRSLFKHFFSFFFHSSQAPLHNANVNVAKLADAYVALTETPLPVLFDPQTLQTLGVFDYQDELPKGKCWESAHPHQDILGTTWNYLIQYGRDSAYILYNIPKDASQRKIVARIPVKEPSYMHSFALTENYIIFTEFPLVVKPLDLITKGKAFIKNFSWQPQRGTQFIVVNRHSGDIAGRYAAKPFFAFHHANAFEKDGKIYLDVVAYEDARIITDDGLSFYNDASDKFYPACLERFTISLENPKVTSEILWHQNGEFPRINYQFDGKAYQCLYLIGFNGSISKRNEADNKESLYKFYTEDKKILAWSEIGCSPGEPVFVPRPGAQDEDDGVVLSLVLDRLHNSSFLLVLDGSSFKEIARARVPHLVPSGLHGQFFSIDCLP